jgi:ribosomal protein S18 acetylase RimI-like enzyme
MNIEIRPLRKKDFNQARKFAIEGMHLAWYAKPGLELYLYSKYVWYLELLRATKVYAAYMDNRLVGFLLAKINNERCVYTSFFARLYVNIVQAALNTFYKDSNNIYDRYNAEMMAEFTKDKKPDGEIVFLAVDPAIHGRGIGSLLLNQLEQDEKGKLIYLYTDSGSTYQFYEKRGFIRAAQRDVKLKIHNQEVSLSCFLYCKTLECKELSFETERL